MTNQPLLDFILTEVKQGATKDAIAKELLGAGWESVDIEEGFKAAGVTDPTPVATPVLDRVNMDSTPTSPVGDFEKSSAASPTFSLSNTPSVSNTVMPVSNPVATTTPTFSTLDSYANPNPGNNPYSSSPVYAGQVIKSTETTTSGGGKKILLFVIVFILVIAGGLVYAVKTNKINLSFVTNLTKTTKSVETTSTKKVATVPENQTPINSNPIAITTTPTTTVNPTTPVLPTTSILPSTPTTKVVTPVPVSTAPVSVVTSMPDLKALCKDAACKTYFGVWVKEQMYQNNVAKSYLNAHIVPQSMKISSWVDGQSFEITYDFVVDWAKARTLDSFMVKTVANDFQYPSLKLRKGIYFSEAEVRTAITNGAYNGQFLWFTPATSLMFATKQDAIDAINKVDTTKKFEISTNAELLPVGQKPSVKKELYLSGFDKSTCKSKNVMTVVRLNLFTGATSTEKTTCVIN